MSEYYEHQHTFKVLDPQIVRKITVGLGLFEPSRFPDGNGETKEEGFDIGDDEQPIVELPPGKYEIEIKLRKVIR